MDEIFTLLEPYLKLSEILSREMSITLLHATLKTFNEGKVKGNKTSECILVEMFRRWLNLRRYFNFRQKKMENGTKMEILSDI